MKRALRMLAILTVAMPFAAANAAVIYENVWNSSATDAGAFSQSGQQLATEFVLPSAATAARATWYGTMFSPDPLNTGDTWAFDVIFYADSGNLPGALISTAAVVAAVTDTGLDITDGFGSHRSYLFDASFAGVGLNAGTSYWFSVVNSGTQGTFRWTESTNGLDSALSFDGGISWTPWSEENRTPLNFALHDGAAWRAQWRASTDSSRSRKG